MEAFLKKKIKFENWDFEKLFENINLKIKFKIREFWRIVWEWNFWKLDLKGIGVLKTYLKVTFKKIKFGILRFTEKVNLKIWILEN